MKKIILTGGGTAGHVTPNLALVPSLREADFDIHYIGSLNGIEKKLITDAGIPYDGISSGKLRRYFDLKNFSDPFRVLAGYAQVQGRLCGGTRGSGRKASAYPGDHSRVGHDPRPGQQDLHSGRR